MIDRAAPECGRRVEEVLRFGIAFAVLGTLIGGGTLAVIVFFLYTIVHSGFD
jgi:hypothetical protein